MGRIFPDNSRAFDKGRGRSGRDVFMIDQVIESFCFSSSILKGSFEGLWNNAGFPRVHRWDAAGRRTLASSMTARATPPSRAASIAFFIELDAIFSREISKPYLKPQLENVMRAYG